MLVGLPGYSSQHRDKQVRMDGSTQYRIKVAKTSACVCVQKTYVSPLCYLTKSKGTRDKTFTMLGEVGMANESTKTTQTSVRVAQHNERTRLA